MNASKELICNELEVLLNDLKVTDIKIMSTIVNNRYDLAKLIYYSSHCSSHTRHSIQDGKSYIEPYYQSHAPSPPFPYFGIQLKSKKNKKKFRKTRELYEHMGY
jgi:hypothetical protein